MIASILLGAATIGSSTSLILEGCITAVSVYGICKGVKGVSTKANYSFKH